MKKTTLASLLMLTTCGALILSGCNSKKKRSSNTSQTSNITSHVTSGITSSTDSATKASNSGTSVEPITSFTPTPVAVEEVTLDFNEISLEVGQSQTLYATVSPSEAENKNVIWSVDYDYYASVDQNGLVTANAIGECYVTVRSEEDSSKSAICHVQIVESVVYPESVSLTYDELTMYVGEQRTLKATVSPYNATTQGMEWNSSDENVATVTGGTISALAEGTTTITVETINHKTATCQVTVAVDVGDDEYVPDTTNENIYFITNTEIAAKDAENPDVTLTEYEFTPDTDKTWEQIYVKAPDKTIILNLEGVTISNNYNSPIYVSTCDEIEISAKKSTTNTITESRSIYTEDDNSLGKGAIFVNDGDLTLKGKGTLNLTATYYNGIHGKDDVSVKNLTLNVTAPHHGIRGNDSLKVDGATLSITCGQDGLSTKNSDVSSKNKQRGDITLTGDNAITINAYADAVDAAHDIIVEAPLSEDKGIYTFKTNKYSSYSGPTIDVSENLFYIKMTSSLYSSGNYSYAAYINGEFYGATYAGTIKESTSGRPGPGGGAQPGGSTTYYVYSMEKPEGATSFILYRYAGSNVTEYSTTSYNAKSDSKTFNASYDLIPISSIYSSKISFGSWSTYVDSPSTKGLKADNKITVLGGTFDIKSLDDGIHANSDTALENGLTPEGIVDIQGGTFTIYSDDDGIHADEDLNISGGNIEVTNSYEGLEATIINISGGNVKVNASDDGVNARTGNKSSAINISGGVLDVTVSPNGDTDGIDSNGTYTQTGGIVIARGPGSTMAAALDSDGTARIDGGTIIILGALGERGLTRGSSVSSYSLSLHSSGSKTVSINGESFTFNNSYSYSKTICYSSVSVTA